MCRLRRVLPLLLILSGLATPASAEPPKAKKALYIGIDGTRFDALRVAKTPHLDKLMEAGIHADNCLILGARYRKNDTISGPGWSSILTGVWADKHGVNDNSFRGKNYQQYPHFFARLKSQQGGAKTVSIVTWKPLHDHVLSHADVAQTYEDDSGDWVQFDKQAADEASQQLAEKDLTCMFLYFGQVDVAGHAFGFHPESAQYVASIERVDEQLGRVLEALRARTSYAEEDWLIVVTSDHGGRGRGHGGGHDSPEILNSLLIVSGPSARRGKFKRQTYLVDAPVTVLAHLGVRIDDAWKLDGAAVGLRGDE
ncbi:MAG: alkaline phosphatase family protein [Pirellulaceae bacterium]